MTRLALILLLLAWPAAAAERVIAAGGAITEIVYALERGGLLVGVDSTSVYPPAARSLPQIGYLRALSAEGVLSLAPDLLLAVEEVGTPKTVDQIRATGVTVVLLPSAHAAEAVRHRILSVGAALGRPLEAQALAERVDADMARLAQGLDRAPRPRVMMLMASGPGAPLVAGRDTAADAMLRLAGAINAVDGYTGYKPLSPEAAIAADPEVILLPAHALQTLGGPQAVLTRPGLSQTRAARDQAVMVVDAGDLLSFGPRVALAARDLALRLHPGLSLPAMAEP